MIGVVIAGHGDFAVELLKTAENIVGSIERCKAITVYPGDKRRDLRNKFIEAIEAVGKSDRVLLMTDMFGGSASNMGYFLSKIYDVKIITGVNLPMVLQLATHREIDNLDELADLVERKGKSSILDAGILYLEKESGKFAKVKSLWRKVFGSKEGFSRE